MFLPGVKLPPVQRGARQHWGLICTDARGQDKVLTADFRETFSFHFASPTSQVRQFLKGNPEFSPLVFAVQDEEINAPLNEQ